ncbi:MAG: lytic transglycosylase domain-containing protein [Rickettsiales bacterium]|jgi:soluble lytic murein transglycosylase|nr:lytic transglycosylase domain-containing protein [Rickettsiales bacterium]
MFFDFSTPYGKIKLFLFFLFFPLDNSLFAVMGKTSLGGDVKNIEKFLLSGEDKKIFEQVRKLLVNKDWTEARISGKKIKNVGFREAMGTYIELKRFKSVFTMSREDVINLINFNLNNYFLREFENFNKRIEFFYLNNTVNFSDVKNYFDKYQSNDINVKVKLFKEEEVYLEQLKNTDPKQSRILMYELNRKIQETWINKISSGEEQEIFLENFSSRFSENNFLERAEMLVFKGNIELLGKLLPLMKNEEHRKLFSSIVGIWEFPESIDSLEEEIPKNLYDNEALVFTKMRYFRLKDLYDKAIDILLNLKGQKKYGQFWYNYRIFFARELLGNKRYQDAYDIICNYNGPLDANYHEALWLSGWIALRFLNKYDLAFKHFNNMYKNAKYPISIAKASYWLGRVSEKKNDRKNAINWYSVSSKYPLTYYGQLASYEKYDLLGEIDRNKLFNFPTAPEINPKDMEILDGNRIVKYALLYYSYENRKEEASEIFNELTSNLLKTKGEVAGLVRIVNGLGDERLSASVSRQASYRMVFFVKNIFPIVKVDRKKDSGTIENLVLLHSIIKQESDFTVNAESSVGAKGIMQIMPATAKRICKDLNIKYNDYQLKHDIMYNIKLGSYYLNRLVRDFGGSKILAIASYNAGPNAVGRWVRDFGDPRTMDDLEDVVDWIESIDYKETRNYLQKVLGNFIVYENIMGSKQ